MNPPGAGTQSAGSASRGAPAHGWTRRDRPCDACRRRKTRCIISKGAEACVLCQSRAEECTYVQSPKRRKRRLVEVNGNEDAAKSRSPEIEQARRIRMPVSDYTTIQGPSLLKKSLGLQNSQYSQYLGMTTEYDTKLINLSPFDTRGEYVSTPGTLRRVSQKTHFIMKSESKQEIEEEMAKLDAIERIVAPHGQALIDLYFRIVHPSFPILHKKVFLEKYSRTYLEFTPPVLAAVYILALNWWSYSPELVVLPKPNVQELEKLVPRTMGDMLNRPKLSTVQAGLLLLQRPDGDSWALTGQLVAVGQNLGLHLDCTTWNIPEWEKALRRRLAWGLYMQDKWGSLIHGRPSHIIKDNWAVRPVQAKDFPETAQDDDEEEGSSEVEKGRLLFVNLISLTEILAEIQDTFFSLRAMMEFEAQEGNPTILILERAKPVQLKLKEWFSKLPPYLSMGDTTARKLSSAGYLHLAYCATEVTLHRAIIRFDTSNNDQRLRQITRMAARMRFITAVEFVKRLGPAHLQSFWYFASKVNLAIIGTFGSLLWATSDLSEESEFYKSQLAEYRWILRVSSKSAEFMKFTVGMLDASTVFMKDTASDFGTPKVPPSQKISESPQDIFPGILGAQDNEDQHTNQSPNVGYPTFHSVEISPDSTGQNSYEQAYPIDMRNMPWENFASMGDFMNGDPQGDWSLDPTNYIFENASDGASLSSRRGVREYDESQNSFGEF